MKFQSPESTSYGEAPALVEPAKDERTANESIVRLACRGFSGRDEERCFVWVRVASLGPDTQQLKSNGPNGKCRDIAEPE